MFEPSKPLPQPFNEVRQLWYEFLAKASQHVRITRAEFTHHVYLDGDGLEVRATIQPLPSDWPTVVLTVDGE
jgi:hypothetical protein